MPRAKETRHYSKQKDLEAIQRYCSLYPWYKRLMEDINVTLATRDSHSGNYRVARVNAPYVSRIATSN